MTVKKVSGGHVVVHCHGKDKGKRISATKHPVSKRKAQSIHRAIMASESSRKEGLRRAFKKKRR